MKVDIKFDADRVVAQLKATRTEVVDVATVRALNRTITSVRAEAARQMRADYGDLPIRVLKGMMRFIRATKRTLTATLVFSGRRIPLVRWGAVQTPYGVRVRRGPSRLEMFDGTPVPPDALRHAFLQVSRRGVRNAWIRIGRARYPITGLVAPSLARNFVEGRIQAALMATARATFARNMESELRFALSK